MNKAQELLSLTEYKHGFDLTGFDSPEDWKKVLSAAGITNQTPTRGSDGSFIWKGSSVTIVTGNDPISGEYMNKNREKEPGYASYIGLEGDEAAVKKAVEVIKDLGDYKDESPGKREFI